MQIDQFIISWVSPCKPRLEEEKSKDLRNALEIKLTGLDERLDFLFTLRSLVFIDTENTGIETGF